MPRTCMLGMAAAGMLWATPVLAQSSIDRFATDCGGGTSTGGVFRVTGAIGQRDAGPLVTGGVYALAGGYWSAITAPPCPADFDGSGALAVADIFAFLNAWFAGSLTADFDGLNGLQVADIFAFLNAWFAGCQ